MTPRSTGRKHFTYPEVFIRTVQCSSCFDATEHVDFFHPHRLRAEDTGRNQAEKAVEKFRAENCNTDLIVPQCDILFPVLKYCLRNLT